MHTHFLFVKEEYLYSQVTSRLAHEALRLSDTVWAVLSFLVSSAPTPSWKRTSSLYESLPRSLTPLMTYSRGNYTSSNPELLLFFFMTWGNTTNSPLMSSKFVEAKSGPALCVLVMGSTGKIRVFFPHLFQGKGKQHGYVVILGKLMNKMQSVKWPDSKWVVRLRRRLWRL